jgi:hypothetical protein
VDKENVVYVHNEILFIYKNNEIMSPEGKQMELEDKMLSKIIRYKKANTACYLLYVKAKNVDLKVKE